MEEGLIWSSRQTESERKRGCVFDHQCLLRHQGTHTHTLAFISPGSLLEVIGKVEVKWARIKFDQTVLIGGERSCVFVCVRLSSAN